jgi:lipid-binding SYLF domain-containing protein
VKTKLALTLLCIAVALPTFAQKKVDKRLSESTEVLKGSIDKPDAIPKNIVDKAACVLVFPSVKKVGVGLGVSYGRGVLTCRKGAKMDGDWSAPAMYALDTGSLGVQLGGSSTDYVMLVMSQKGADKVLSGKLKLGSDASAVAGPSGARATGFNDPNADVVIYSRAQGGLFAGASLGTASLKADDDANKDLYGKSVDVQQIVRDGAVDVPPPAKPLITLLDKTSPKRAS